MIESLNDGVQMVMLQFSFSNYGVVPASVKLHSWETPEENRERKSHSSGKLVIEPILNCSLAQFVGKLEAERYELVDAGYIERVNAKSASSSAKSYHVVRFIFARRENAVLADGFKKGREAIRTDLQKMCEDALWRIRMFHNPFYYNGVAVPDQHAVCINLEVRQPIVYPNGQPIKRRQMDTDGSPIGDPLPIKADYLLGIQDGAIRLVLA